MSLAEVRHALMSRSSKGARTTFSRKYFPHKAAKTQYRLEQNRNKERCVSSSWSEFLPPTLQSFSTFVVADQMTPLGCRCNVLLLSRELRTCNGSSNNEHHNTNNMADNSNIDLESVTEELERRLFVSSSSSPSEYIPNSSSASHFAESVITLHAKLKVTLPELAPRDIVHIKGNYLDAIMHNKCLPQNVMNNKRVYRKRIAHQYNNDQRKNNKRMNNQKLAGYCGDDNGGISEDVMNESVATHRNNLLTKVHSFEDCPWSALSTSLSSAVKQKILKRYVENVIQRHKANSTVNEYDDNNGNDNKIVQVRYYEPLSIQIIPNRLQEVNFVFIRECCYTSTVHNKNEFVYKEKETSRLDNNKTEVEQHKTKQTGYFALASYSNEKYDVDHSGTVTDSMYKQTQSHPLLTLEQKRLLVALNTWVADVPFLIQATLHSVNIHQPSHVPSTRPWDASLIVTLCVAKPHENNDFQSNNMSEKKKRSNNINNNKGNNLVYYDDDNNIDGNPLNNTINNNSSISNLSLPANDILSAEEQRLLHFILNATPLIKHVELHLINLSTLHWEKLYPTIIRSVLSASTCSVSNSNNANGSSNYLPEIINDTQHQLATQKSRQKDEFDDQRSIMFKRCHVIYSLSPIRVDCVWCARPFIEYIPALSSTLWRYVLDAYKHAHVRYSKLGLEYKGSSIVETAMTNYVYTLPFWRHYQSLSETCSLLLSLTLEPFGPIPSIYESEGKTNISKLDEQYKELTKQILLYGGESNFLQVMRKYRCSVKVADPVVGHAKLFDILHQVLRTLAKINKSKVNITVISKDDNAKQNMHYYELSPSNKQEYEQQIKQWCSSSTKSDNTENREEGCKNDLPTKELSPWEHELICICCLTGDVDDHNVLTTLLKACSNYWCHNEGRIRLVLVECSVDLRLSLLRDALSVVLLACTESVNKGNKENVHIALHNLQSGVVNVDPLSSSMIGYCTCDLMLRPNK